MFEIIFLILVLPIVLGVACAYVGLLAERPHPVIHERRQPWPNPFG